MITASIVVVANGISLFDRLETRVAASRRILALAKRREDVGHRLKLFESGDEERRNSGAGVQLQVRASHIGLFRFYFGAMRLDVSRCTLSLTRLLSLFAGRAIAPHIAAGAAAHHGRIARDADAGERNARRYLRASPFVECVTLLRSGNQLRIPASCTTALRFCKL